MRLGPKPPYGRGEKKFLRLALLGALYVTVAPSASSSPIVLEKVLSVADRDLHDPENLL